jgi:hypothetical protein
MKQDLMRETVKFHRDATHATIKAIDRLERTRLGLPDAMALRRELTDALRHLTRAEQHVGKLRSITPDPP